MTLEEVLARCVVEAARRVTRTQLRQCEGLKRARQSKGKHELSVYEQRFRFWLLRLDQQLASKDNDDGISN
jgi:hypothetical protein